MSEKNTKPVGFLDVLLLPLKNGWVNDIFMFVDQASKIRGVKTKGKGLGHGAELGPLVTTRTYTVAILGFIRITAREALPILTKADSMSLDNRVNESLRSPV